METHLRANESQSRALRTQFLLVSDCGLRLDWEIFCPCVVSNFILVLGNFKTDANLEFGFRGAGEFDSQIEDREVECSGRNSPGR